MVWKIATFAKWQLRWWFLDLETVSYSLEIRIFTWKDLLSKYLLLLSPQNKKYLYMGMGSSIFRRLWLIWNFMLWKPKFWYQILVCKKKLDQRYGKNRIKGMAKTGSKVWQIVAHFFIRWFLRLHFNHLSIGHENFLSTVRDISH